MFPVGTKIPVGTERRFALVIGNKDYQYIRSLRNTLNDAADMKTSLQGLGFDVTMVQNTDYRSLVGSINRFVTKLQSDDVALVYYSGHGLSYNGKNYLLPIDAQVNCLEQLDEHGYSLNKIVGDIAVRRVKNSFYLLDACRNVPNLKLCTATTKDVLMPSGLVKPSNNPRGSMIVYATEEGSTADDNVSERNGLFTGALLKFLTQPNLGIRSILDLTTSDVLSRTNDSQSPARYDKLLGDFVFIQSVTPPTPQPTEVTTPVVVPSNVSPEPKPSIVKKADLLPYEPAMVFVKGGTFQMGSNDGKSIEKPVHQVLLSHYSIGKYEITVGEYLTFCDATNSHYPEWLEAGSKYHIETGSDTYYKSQGYSLSSLRLPIIGVSWNDAVAYCQWLSSKTGKIYRLPTEAEWEYAARGGQGSLAYTYAGSNTAENVGWVNGKSASKPHEVGLKVANELGIYDMTGNVWEWCSDWYGVYSSATQANPQGPSTGTSRVLRGGGWDNFPQYSRVAYRINYTPDYRDNNFGFRVCVP